MVPSFRKTPLDFPRENLLPKTYSAVLLGNGSVLPVEERLGRRLLRTLSADSPEARALLARGHVTLRQADGRVLGSLPLSRALERLAEQARVQLERSAGDPATARRFREALHRLRAARTALPRDH